MSLHFTYENFSLCSLTLFLVIIAAYYHHKQALSMQQQNLVAQVNIVTSLHDGRPGLEFRLGILFYHRVQIGSEAHPAS
jgi:hypothetical protein